MPQGEERLSAAAHLNKIQLPAGSCLGALSIIHIQVPTINATVSHWPSLKRQNHYEQTPETHVLNYSNCSRG